MSATALRTTALAAAALVVWLHRLGSFAGAALAFASVWVLAAR